MYFHVYVNRTKLHPLFTTVSLFIVPANQVLWGLESTGTINVFMYFEALKAINNVTDQTKAAILRVDSKCLLVTEERQRG